MNRKSLLFSAGREYTKPFCINVNLSNDGLRVYRWMLVFLQYLTPMCVISFVYTRIALKLWGTKAPGNAENTRDATLMKNKKKVYRTNNTLGRVKDLVNGSTIFWLLGNQNAGHCGDSL